MYNLGVRFLTCKENVFLKANVCYSIIPLKQQSTLSKHLLRRQDKFKTIEPLGWFLLVIPISSFCVGVWQIQRKKWKENLLADLEVLTNSDPVPLPESLDEIKKLEYKPVHVKGNFLHDQELYIGPRALLMKGDASTQSFLVTGKPNKNQGYLVVTPFKLANKNETILVNRGWVPIKQKDQRTRQDGQVEGQVDLIGIVRLNENRPSFMPRNQGTNFYFYRDLQQMAVTAGTLPVFLDATNEFDVPNGPIGGQTRISLRNEHLSYIYTFFSLSVATFYMWFKMFLK